MKLALPGSLLALSAFLLAAIGYELLAPLGAVNIEAPRAPVLHPVAPVAQVAPPSIDLFADMDARPLFNPKRTPLPDSRLAGSSGSSDLTLIGVMIGGEKPLALFKSASASTTTTATIGDIVGGLRVVQIAPTQVALRGSSGLLVIPLASLGSQTPTAPLPAPAAATASEPASPAPAPSTAQPATAQASAPAQPGQTPATPRPAAQSATPAAKPPAVATVSAPAAVTVSAKPALPVRSGDGTIAAEALKGAPINPKTGEPTL